MKTGNLTWKKASLKTAYLDFAKLIGEPRDAVAYACTYIHAPAAVSLRMNLTYVGAVRACINGKAGKDMGGARVRVDLEKGWNRIMLKVSHGEPRRPRGRLVRGAGVSRLGAL